MKASVTAAPGAQTPFRAWATMTSRPHSFPGSPGCRVELRCRQAVRIKAHLVQAGVRTRGAAGDHHRPSGQSTISILLQERASTCGILSAECRLPTTLPQFYQPRGLVFPGSDPRLGHLISDSSHSLQVKVSTVPPSPLCPLPGAQILTPALCPFLTDCTRIFSQPWLCRSPLPVSS